MAVVSPTLLSGGSFQFFRSQTALLASLFTLSTFWAYRKEILIIRGIPALPLGVFALLVVVSSAVALHPEVAFLRNADWIAFIGFGLASMVFYRNCPKFLPFAMAAVVGGYLLGVLQIVLAWLSMEDPVHFLWATNVPGFQHIRHVGLHGLGVLAILTYFLTTAKAPLSRWGIAALVVVVWASLFWTGGRGAVFSALFLVLCCGALLFRKKGLQLSGMFLLLMVAGAFLSTFFQAERIGLNRIFLLGGKTESVDQFSSGRLELWRHCLDQAGSHWPLGVGADHYLFYPHPHKYVLEAHNFLIQAVFEWGYPALLLFVGMGLLLTIRWAQAAGESPRAAVAFAAFLAYCVYGLFDGPFYYPAGMLMIGLFSALLFYEDGRVSKTMEKFQISFTAHRAFLVVGIGFLLHFFAVLQYLSYFYMYPKPDSLYVQLSQRVTFTTFGAWQWANHWEETDPEAAMAWYDWGQQYGEYSWKFHRDAAVLHYWRKEFAQAHADFQQAINTAPSPVRRGLEESAESLFPGLEFSYQPKVNSGGAD